MINNINDMPKLNDLKKYMENKTNLFNINKNKLEVIQIKIFDSDIPRMVLKNSQYQVPVRELCKVIILKEDNLTIKNECDDNVFIDKISLTFKYEYKKYMDNFENELNQLIEKDNLFKLFILVKDYKSNYIGLIRKNEINQ